MNIDIEIPDITQDQVIEAMAARLLGSAYEHSGDPDDPTPVPSKWDRKAIGKHLRVYFEAKIKETVATMVDEAIGDAIRATITESVRAVCHEGWPVTDSYGRVTGRRTLKDIVLAQLTHTSGYRDQTVVDTVAREAIEKSMKAGFEAEMAAARKKFAEQADALVQAKFTETIKSALGLR